jgi:hypothetical protein
MWAICEVVPRELASKSRIPMGVEGNVGHPELMATLPIERTPSSNAGLIERPARNWPRPAESLSPFRSNTLYQNERVVLALQPAEVNDVGVDVE